MRSELLRGSIATASFLLVGGCAIFSVDPPTHHVGNNPVSVVMPMEPENQTFTVHFGTQFVPGTFKAQLDGKDITQSWAPPNPPASGAARWVGLDIFQGGSCVPGPFPYGSSSVTPPELCTHTLHFHGDVAVSNGLTDVDINFIPVQLALLPKDPTGRYYAYTDTIELTPNQTITVSLNANTYGPWPEGNFVAVEAMDATGSPAHFISLNGGGAGQTANLMIQGQNGTDFTVRALDTIASGSRWLLRLRARAIGVQEVEYRQITVIKP